MEKMIVCRCEEVTLDEIVDTVKTYDCSLREVKLRTRAGMGYCGGRTCRQPLQAIVENVSGKKPEHDIPLKVQPPVRPVTLGTLGGLTNE